MSLRFSLSLTLGVLTLSLAACDRDTPEDAQPDTAQEKGSGLTGKLDRDQAGTLVPDISVAHPDGSAINVAALQGTPVLVNLWATWCAPCIEEMPMLDELAADYGDSLRVLTISQDLQGAEKVPEFFAKNEYENLEPWLDPDNAMSFHYGASTTLPMTVLYDAQGMEVWRVTGGYDWSSPEARGLVDEGIEAE
ncbi:TlpA family protein disulfide reductase [Altererythrobacter sp. ZODW24]|uniref:TlpA family protein disulfide reductase n=1 Tax=Altererythrobacter sp. ZODW24 TaxID=2185142 RepID=UPI001F083A9F|nr:TlpA family protein disulfide reductase [Altererythrobacter sp. ZODW24]